LCPFSSPYLVLFFDMTFFVICRILFLFFFYFGFVCDTDVTFSMLVLRWFSTRHLYTRTGCVYSVCVSVCVCTCVYVSFDRGACMRSLPFLSMHCLSYTV
jgi:hypothetical protein